MDINISKIIRSHRRTIALEIEKDASLIVRVPRALNLDQINSFIEKKRDWILKQQRVVLWRIQETPNKKFSQGEKFLYLGLEYPLFITENTLEPLHFKNGFLLSRSTDKDSKQAFISWYMQEAKKVIAARICIFSAILGVKPSRITITNAHTRWGSCSKDRLSFTWRLIMAPLEIIDYVVVHELAHIIEKNHSRKFWHKVESLILDYRLRRSWLKKYGHRLCIE